MRSLSIALAFLFLLTSTQDTASETRNSNLPEITGKHVSGEILVGYKKNTSVWKRRIIQNKVGINAGGIEHIKSLNVEKISLIPGLSVAEAMARLRSMPGVDWVEPNWLGQPFAVPQDPNVDPDPTATMNQWGIFNAGVHVLWKSYGGAGARVAIIDTGILPHADLPAFVAGKDFVDGDANPTDAGGDPKFGHGTSVAGIIAAKSDAFGMAGVAYAAPLLIARAFDCSLAGCDGSAFDVAAAISWAVELGNDADVINMSWGFSPKSAAIHAALVEARCTGGVLIAATGNSAGPVRWPASDPLVIAVGASTADSLVWGDSNFGPEVDVVAPGEAIVTTIPGGSHGPKSGTSFAAPLVSGIAALLLARNPMMTPGEVRYWLRVNTLDLPGTKDGFGLVHYGHLIDASDFLSIATHQNHLWEWLGKNVTVELSPTDPIDIDGRVNADPSPDGGDLGDDGTLPILPLLPGSISLLDNVVDYSVSVDKHDGPRYAASLLFLDTWIDWNSSGTFELPKGELVLSRTLDPSTWTSDSKALSSEIIADAPEHILGNPLRMRTRLTYGVSPSKPDSMASTGEVEDIQFINLVEDFECLGMPSCDVPGVFLAGDWFPTPDPQPFFSNHGTGVFFSGPHPFSSPCDGTNEGVALSSPSMDWTEYSTARLSMVFWHGFMTCGAGDKCRVELYSSGVLVDSLAIPTGGGPFVFDVSGHTGPGASDMVFVIWSDTDSPGTLLIDDVVIVAEDMITPATLAAPTATFLGGGLIGVAVDFTSGDEGGPESSASGFAIRYHTTPILDLATWKAAVPLGPLDTPGLFPLPGPPGSLRGADFAVPSAKQDYYFAISHADEVSDFAPASPSTMAAAMDTHGTAATAAPDTVFGVAGDSVDIVFTFTNLGNQPETICIFTEDLFGWGNRLLSSPFGASTHAFAEVLAGATVTDTVRTLIPDTTSAGVVNRMDLNIILADASPITIESGYIMVDVSTAISESQTPTTASLGMRGPNPFRKRTTFQLALTKAQDASAVIYDARGRLVKILVKGSLPPGIHDLIWDGRNGKDQEAAAGIYFLKVRADELHRTERIVKVR